MAKGVVPCLWLRSITIPLLSSAVIGYSVAGMQGCLRRHFQDAIVPSVVYLE
jgi:hypothetical protein